ncbi:hypothetical protein F9L07_19770 [Pimelobacter simplex]|uniref:Uncharacterized protein n=1 Tax=Nocardioides simplex TaxID=2045 RepID=A0A7J5DVJ2_NOCSI|nr:hypothetical protein [Pimelobacter simplex]KAB2809282.1 hypothetical protein F9L07_19770 [Pimelobacter simplex]
MVRELSKTSGTIKLRYEVWCAVTQRRIITTARIYDQTTNRYSATGNKDCREDYWCQVTITMPDKAGTQTYRAEGVDCLPGYPSCVTLAVSRSGSTTESTEMLPCAAPCLGGMVIRRKDL